MVINKWSFIVIKIWEEKVELGLLTLMMSQKYDYSVITV